MALKTRGHRFRLGHLLFVAFSCWQLCQLMSTADASVIPQNDVMGISKRVQHYCGSELVQALQYVCGDKGIFSPGRKRTDIRQMQGHLSNQDQDYNINLALIPANVEFVPLSNDLLEDIVEFDSGNNDLNRRSTSSSLTTRRYRRSPGIVDECCHSPCSEQTLRMYCN